MSESDVRDSEAAKGGGTEGPSPSKDEVAGLRAALQAVRERDRDHKAELDRLRAEMDALKQQKTSKEYSRAELQAHVDEGRMSQIEADRILEQQQERKLEQTVSQRIEEESSKRDLKARLETEIGRYTTVYPEVLQEGTPLRERIAAEFDRQLRLGKPKNLQTELDALAVVLGPPDTLSKGQDKPRQTHQDVGSDGGGEGDGGSSSPKLPARVKTHYQGMIDKGMYKGWDDPSLKTEIEKYSRPGWT